MRRSVIREKTHVKFVIQIRCRAIGFVTKVEIKDNLGSFGCHDRIMKQIVDRA